MKYVTLNNKIWVSSLILLSSCSLKSNGDSVKVRIPLPGAKVSILERMTDWMSLAWASGTTTLNLDTVPSSLSDFDCFAVNVTGPGIAPDSRVSCTSGDAPSIMGGFVPAGESSIDLDVPSGPARTIKVFGARSIIGCPQLGDLLQGGAISFNGNIGKFYEIGTATADVFNDSSVTIHVGYNSASPVQAFSQCKQTNGGQNGTHLWGVWAGSGPGTVRATKTVGTTTYIGGSFDYVGPTTGNAVKISAAQSASPTIQVGAHIDNGTVRCVTPDGTGGYYVGGSFSIVNSHAVQNVVHLLSSGDYDPNFTVTTNGSVNACVFDGVYLHLGGSFSSVTAATTQTANGLAAIHLSDGAIGTYSTALPASSIVNALALDPTSHTLYVGGSFTVSAYYNAIAYDSSTLTFKSSWNPSPDNTIYALALDAQNHVYLGGGFTNLSTNGRIAQIDATTGAVQSWDVTPAVTYPVMAIAVDRTNGKVYYSDAGTSANLYRADGSTAAATAIFSASSSSINALALSTDNASLYVGGNFVSGSQRGLVQITNPLSTPSVSTSFAGSINNSGSVSTLMFDSAGNLFVGGNFVSIGGMIRKNLAAFDLTTGIATFWGPSISNIGTVVALDADSNQVYAAFDAVTSLYAGGVMGISTSLAASTYSWLLPTGSYSDHVYAMTRDSNSLYVGGQFSMFGGGTHSGIARVDISSGTGTLDSTWSPLLVSASTLAVRAIAVSSSAVYAGGTIDSLGGTNSHGLVSINPSSGLVSSGWSDPNLASGVNVITFGPLGDIVTDYATSIVRVDPTTGSILSTITALSGKVSNIRALTFVKNVLYIGGTAQSSTGDALIAYDWVNQTIGTGFDASIGNYNTVYSIEPITGTLLVGGYFQQVNLSNGTGGKMSPAIAEIDAITGALF